MPARVLLQDFTGVPAVVDLAAMRDGVVRLGGDPEEGQSAAARRAGHRPLGPGRSLRRAERVRAERRARVLAQPRALHVPALGPDGVRQLQGRPARHRHRPPGQSRVPRARRLQRAGGGDPLAYPDTLVGTDSHTTMVNGLGVVGWGVGGIEAEAAMLGQPISMLIPRGRRLPPDQPPAGRGDRDRSRADDHRAAAQARRRRQVRRVLRARPRVPDDRRSRDARQHVAGIRRDDRDLPDRRHDARLPAPDRARRGAGRSSSRRTRRSRGSSARPTRRSDLHADDRARPRRRSSRASPARSGRRIACR